MDVSAVVAGTAHMQVEMAMLMGTVMKMVVSVQLKTERSADRQSTHDQKGDTHKEFRPRRHGLHMGQVFEADGDQGQNHDSGGVTGPPGHGMPKGRQRLVQ
jgi:hypothetical protein